MQSVEASRSDPPPARPPRPCAASDAASPASFDDALERETASPANDRDAARQDRAEEAATPGPPRTGPETRPDLLFALLAAPEAATTPDDAARAGGASAAPAMAGFGEAKAVSAQTGKTSAATPVAAEPGLAAAMIAAQPAGPALLPADAGPPLLVAASPGPPPAAAAANAPSDARPPPPVALADVPVAVAAQIGAGERRFEIRLDPAELGRVEVSLSVGADGQSRAHLIVERPATLHQLMQDAPRLEQALNAAGAPPAEGGLSFSLDQQRAGGGPPREAEPASGDADAAPASALWSTARPAILRHAASRLDLTL